MQICICACMCFQGIFEVSSLQMLTDHDHILLRILEIDCLTCKPITSSDMERRIFLYQKGDKHIYLVSRKTYRRKEKMLIKC